MMNEDHGASYASAGVDIEAGDRAVELIKPLGAQGNSTGGTGRPRRLRWIVLAQGRFSATTAGCLHRRCRQKIAVAQAMDKHDTVGLDLVAMVVDDLVVCGAEPLFLQDDIAVGRVARAGRRTGLGASDGCVRAGCALLGGETAENPGLIAGRLRPLRHRRRRRRGRRSSAPTGAARRHVIAMGRRACTPTATRWPARCCWTSTG